MDTRFVSKGNTYSFKVKASSAKRASNCHKIEIEAKSQFFTTQYYVPVKSYAPSCNTTNEQKKKKRPLQRHPHCQPFSSSLESNFLIPFNPNDRRSWGMGRGYPRFAKKNSDRVQVGWTVGLSESRVFWARTHLT